MPEEVTVRLDDGAEEVGLDDLSELVEELIGGAAGEELDVVVVVVVVLVVEGCATLGALLLTVLLDLDAELDAEGLL